MTRKKNPDIETLLSERAKYETWLQQLAAKASQMPDHVVERVRGDYQQRLTHVVDDLRSRADDLRGESESLAERIAELASQLTEKRDARAEDELRAMVGEYEEQEWAAKAAEHDGGIGTLDTERTEREAELARVNELLAEATRPSRAMRRISETDIPEEPSPTGLDAVAEPVAELPVTAPEQSAPPVPVQIEAPPSVPVAAVAPPPAAEPLAPRVSVGATPPPPPVEPPPGLKRPSPFDEISFLRTVVGRATPYAGVHLQPDPNAPPVPTASAGGAAPAPAPPAPSAVPVVPSGPPTIVAPAREEFVAAPAAPRRSIPSFEPPPIPDMPAAAPARASAPSMPANVDPVAPPVADGVASENYTPRNSQTARSLKCQECGWMNFPTEWYCEKCGGELAAF